MAITILNHKSGGFNEWLSSQTGRKDPVGKFARWIKLDRCWPRDVDDYVAFRTHIRARHYNNNSYTMRVAAFEIAWEEYQSSLVVTVGDVIPSVSETATVRQISPSSVQQEQEQQQRHGSSKVGQALLSSKA